MEHCPIWNITEDKNGVQQSIKSNAPFFPIGKTPRASNAENSSYISPEGSASELYAKPLYLMLKKMLTIEINGNNFSTLAGFYDEIERNMTKGLDWKIGRNLNAFNDVLRGGFGVHNCDEDYKLIWLNSNKSQSELNEFTAIVELITENENAQLELN